MSYYWLGTTGFNKAEKTLRFSSHTVPVCGT